MLIDFGKVDADAKRWLEFHSEPERVDGNKVAYRIRVKCNKLQNGLCSIYDMRPKMCIDYKVGSQACLNSILKFRSKKEQKKIFEALDATIKS